MSRRKTEIARIVESPRSTRIVDAVETLGELRDCVRRLQDEFKQEAKIVGKEHAEAAKRFENALGKEGSQELDRLEAPLNALSDARRYVGGDIWDETILNTLADIQDSIDRLATYKRGKLKGLLVDYAKVAGLRYEK